MNQKQKKNLTRIILCVVILILYKIFDIEENSYGIYFYLIPYLLIGYDILLNSLKGLRKKRLFDENFLMAIATVGAIGLKDYQEGVAVMLFYQIGELFQSIAIRKSRRNISELMDIRPDYANIMKDGSLIQVDPNEIKVNDEIVVKVGEKIPVDGIVVDGSSILNTSSLTGESKPKEVKENDEVISGCINMQSLLKIRVTKEFSESTASKILDLVENASSNKSQSENFISKFAHYYTPIVCFGALVLAILPPFYLSLFKNQTLNFSPWILRSLTFLVISCPCALVISIPLSFFGGIGGASNAGILIKGSNYLEKLAQTKIIAFDKTGTMTKGVFEVMLVHNNGFTKEEILEYAAYSEVYSSHPIGKSIVKEYGKKIDEGRVKSITEIPGKGIKALIDNYTVLVGNDAFMLENNIETIPCNEEGSIVHVTVDNDYKGHIHIGDILKPTSKQAIQKLKNSAIQRLIMLTGDESNIANKVSKELKIDEVYSELLPQDKVAIINKLQSNKNEKEVLAFVGDGINDAPVLAQANIGIAMGALGSDAAIEAADIVLMDDDPLNICKAIAIAQKCMRIVYENIVFAIGVKAVCLILGALGIASMWLAIFADVGVMILAVINAIRALNVKYL